jgi:hypothetical protein
MAIELLDKANTRHEVHHDLESFYWLLTWITLRYTAHNHDDGALACHKLFDVDNPAALKRNWLIGDSPLDNEASPLYILAEAMRQLTQQQPRIQKQKRITFSFVRDPPKIDAEPLTYALIELAFKVVVEDPSWENFEDAPALPFNAPPKTYNVAGKRKTETHELRRSAIANSQAGRDTPAGGSGPLTRSRNKKRKLEEDTSAPAANSAGSTSRSEVFSGESGEGSRSVDETPPKVRRLSKSMKCRGGKLPQATQRVVGI